MEMEMEMEMEGEGEDHQNKSKVVKVDSKDSWDFYATQATIQGCPIVAHFTAAWCMPSVMMNPYIEELASTHQNVLFLTVDVDEVKEVAAKYEIKAMPTFLMMKGGGQLVDKKLVGANPDEIKKWIAGLPHSSPISVVA